MDKDPLSTSFHALKTLKLVHELRSFSAAAESLDQNQSSVSYTIDLLRKTFNDPLFVRQGNHIASTNRCDEIVLVAKSLLESFEVLVLEQPFDPSQAQGFVVISCNYYERAVILPTLLRELRIGAPNLKVEVIPAGIDGERQLRHGECDILLSPSAVSGEDIFRSRICDDTYCCVMDKNNPLSQGDFDLGRFQQSSHVFVTHGGRWRPIYLEKLAEHGVTISPSVSLPSLGDLEPLLRDTDLVATIPRRVASRYTDALAIVPMPVDITLSTQMFWSSRTHRSPLYAWVRALISQRSERIKRVGS